MSEFSHALATSQQIITLAAEEAARSGVHLIDIDHLLVALTLSEQVGGQVLRAQGMSAETVRAAIDAQHASQLAGLGIETATALPSRGAPTDASAFDLTPRARSVLTDANRRSRRGDASAVLRQLLTEPSGMIVAILARLQTTPRQLTSVLDYADRVAAEPRRNTSSLSGTSEAFVPATAAEVWSLLTDVARMPEWEPVVGSVEDAPAALRAGTSWLVHPRTQAADGKPITVKSAYSTCRVEATVVNRGAFLELLYSYPNAPRANRRRIGIHLEQAAGGTQLRVSLQWERAKPRPWWGIVPATLMRPLYRYAIWVQLTALGSGIARAFR